MLYNFPSSYQTLAGISLECITSVDTAQFCLGKNSSNCLLSMNERARRCVFCTVSKHDKFSGLPHFRVKTYLTVLNFRGFLFGIFTIFKKIRGLRGFEPKPTWVKTIYRRCNFTRRAGTTTRPQYLAGCLKSASSLFRTDVSRAIAQLKIPPELALNTNQTPSSYVLVERMTMASKNSSSVPNRGLTDKRNITLTFVISFSGEFSPMQIIYQGKTSRSQPVGFKFPNGFAVSQNEKHHSNEAETLSLIDKVIKPFVEGNKKELKLPLTQKALLIWDVFKGQKTETVLLKLASLISCLYPYPLI